MWRTIYLTQTRLIPSIAVEPCHQWSTRLLLPVRLCYRSGDPTLWRIKQVYQYQVSIIHREVLFISSREPKAPVSFSDRNVSVVRRRCHRCRKLFTFS